MKQLVILGAGAAGTMMVRHLNRKLDKKDWSITIIDEYPQHYYQPGFLFLPFGIYSEKQIVKDKRKFLPKSARFILEGIEEIKPEGSKVKLKSGREITYDILIIATGAKIVPEEIDGLVGDGWRNNIFDFYTIEGAAALRDKFKTWEGGKLVVHLSEMPIKCPIAPLEFTFLSDWFLTKKGIRREVDLTYVTPLSGAFTKENCSNVLGYMLREKQVNLVADFNVEKVDSASNKLVAYDGKEVEYDLLVTIPTNMGDPVIARSGLGDDLNFVPTDKFTLQAKAHENIFVLGDATDLPSSKAGSVAHFQSEILTKNILNFIHNRPLAPEFDGHANCFIESGFGKAFLIDFNYDLEPVQGKFPFPVVGPLSLLKETRFNHMGKMFFKWVYWNMLLRGITIPFVSSRMSTAGKIIPENLKKQKEAANV